MSRTKNRKKKADLQGIVLLGVVVLSILCGGFYYFKIQSEIVSRNKVDLCRDDGFVARETAIIIDATDDFNESQALIVKKEFEKVIGKSLIDERFSVYVINENISDKKPLVVACNAGDGSDKNEYTSNLRRLKLAWEQQFFNKIVGQIDELVGEHEADESPIMEFIKFVSVETFYSSNANDKRLIIVSDMLHHTSSFSHYTPTTNFFNSSYSLEVRPYLEDIEVNVLYVYRPQYAALQNRKHIEFWEKYFSDGNGSLVRVKTIN
ncbi:hypothetical protein [Glaciecola sp. HTCC2999]|uniref:hypothetical protein n=1 Tax=Glaciecola sp. HTCC2999 TaxID=455436 RepID=UPI0000E0E592|nr:hypothetical protein [Glaciecola sp. HTCC2999]